MIALENGVKSFIMENGVKSFIIIIMTDNIAVQHSLIVLYGSLILYEVKLAVDLMCLTFIENSIQS